MPVSTWDSHTRVPKRAIIFDEKKDLRYKILRSVVLGVLGAVYCGIRWKRTLPNLSTSILVRKMATAFIGLAPADALTHCIQYNVSMGPPAKQELNDHIMLNDFDTESKFRTFHKLLEYSAESAGYVAFIISYYNAKFVLAPCLAIILGLFFELPTTKDIKNGTYIKFTWDS